MTIKRGGFLRRICIAGSKGGVGKTTSAVNIAHAMAKHKRTLLVDANLSTPNVHIHLGWPLLKKTLVDVLKGQSSVREAIYTHESGMRILPSISSVRDIKTIKHEKLKYVTEDLQGMADVVLLDSAAGIGKEALSAIEASDEVLIITNPELTSVLDAQKTVQLSHELGKTVLGVILTKVKGDKHEMKLRDVERLLDLPVIGIVPYDDNVRRSLKLGSPVTHTHKNSKAAKSYNHIGTILAGKHYYHFNSRKDKVKEYIMKKLGIF
jgi:septum site-determining protein MinD